MIRNPDSQQSKNNVQALRKVYSSYLPTLITSSVTQVTSSGLENNVIFV